MLFSIFFFTLISATFAAVCTDPWVPIGDYCYLFAAEKLNWNDARSLCIFSTGDLAVFDLTCEDYSEVFHHATAVGMTSPWIGATDLSLEGYWEWVDGRPMDLRQNYWSNTQPTPSNLYNCALMLKDSFDRWVLVAHVCDDSRDFICQRASQETNRK